MEYGKNGIFLNETVGLPVFSVLGVVGVVFTLDGGYAGGVTGTAFAEYNYERLK